MNEADQYILDMRNADNHNLVTENARLRASVEGWKGKFAEYYDQCVVLVGLLQRVAADIGPGHDVTASEITETISNLFDSDDVQELVETWVRIRYDLELRGELAQQLDALAKKFGHAS